LWDFTQGDRRENGNLDFAHRDFPEPPRNISIGGKPENEFPLSIIPVVPHKAVAEVSKNRKPIGEIGCCESGMAERSH